MDRKKVLYCLVIIMACFACGLGVYGVGFARHHAPVPGYDEPYDPVDYYSKTSISYADSAPSPFALKDLARQGGDVYDYARHLKSVLSAQNAKKWLAQALDILGLDIKNTTPWEKIGMTVTQAQLEALQADTDSNNHSKEAALAWANDSFSFKAGNGCWSATYGQQQDNYSKASALLGTYGNAVQSALAAMEAEEQARTAIYDMAVNAEGELQSLQAEAEAEALLATDVQRRNMLLGNIASVQAVEHKLDQAENEVIDQGINDSQLVIEDPYNRTERSQKLYTRPEPKGFIKF